MGRFPECLNGPFPSWKSPGKQPTKKRDLKSRILWMHTDLIAFVKDSTFWEPESNKSAMISVNLCDHAIDVWDAGQLAQDTESLRKVDATSDTAKFLCEVDSSSNDLEGCRLRCVNVLRFLVYDVRWNPGLPTKRSLRTPERGPMTQRDSMILAWSSLERNLRGGGSYTLWPEQLREISFFFMVCLTSFSE